MVFNETIIDFFKRHNLYDEKMFDYIANRCNKVDYYDHNINFTVGCPARINSKTKRIEDFQLVIPYCVNEVTTMIAVHEIAHAIYWYKKIGQKCKIDEVELFPMLLERIFMEENRTPKLESYEKFLDDTIDETSETRYRFALENRDALMQSDLKDFNTISKSIRKLARRWKRNNR